jgi:hypothetical protein
VTGDSVLLNLHRETIFIANISTSAPNVGSYFWTVDPSTPPGNNYTIELRYAPNFQGIIISDIFSIQSGANVNDAPSPTSTTTPTVITTPPIFTWVTLLTSAA